MIIRRESFTDVDAVDAMVARAFQDMQHSDGAEPQIIARLRKAGALSLALVAEVEGRVVGHIAFSPVGLSVGEPGWFCLGPLAVHPDFQRQDIGTALVLGGLELMRDDGAAGVILLGNPQFYGRFGFRSDAHLVAMGMPSENLLALPFEGDMPSGTVAFHRAFFGEV